VCQKSIELMRRVGFWTVWRALSGTWPKGRESGGIPPTAHRSTRSSARANELALARAHAIGLHGWLSPVALALVVGHALILLADRYIRFDVFDLIVPLVTPYRPLAVGIGVIAAHSRSWCRRASVCDATSDQDVAPVAPSVIRGVR
jgi:hypothetical protein